MAFKARFIPRNPEKYVGDATNIFARSSWEVTCMKYFDSHPGVLRWGSEEIVIPYLNPLDNKVHNYYPDFFVEYVDRNGNKQREIVEVKPLHETEERFAKSDRSRSALLVNTAKWKAASIFCEQRDMRFRVLTEKSIFHQGKKKPRKTQKPRD